MADGFAAFATAKRHAGARRGFPPRWVSSFRREQSSPLFDEIERVRHLEILPGKPAIQVAPLVADIGDDFSISPRAGPLKATTVSSLVSQLS
jgi:hypothetical protein